MKVYMTKAFGQGPGNRPGQMGVGQATAEVYRFYFGRWWLESFTVEPGDRIGRTEALRRQSMDPGPQAIDYGTEWFVLDIVSDIDADRYAVDRGWGASVLLQNLSDPTTTALHDPRLVANDEERDRLKEAVDLADMDQESVEEG